MPLSTHPPIFIFGQPRTGTRMIANILHAHPDIVVTDEIPAKFWVALHGLKAAGDASIAPIHWRAPVWTKVKTDLVMDALVKTSRTPIQEKAESSNRLANKTPNLELYFDTIMEVFSDLRPRFIYCLRRPDKVLASLKNMPWNSGSVKSNFVRFTRSVAIFERIQRENLAPIKLIQVDRVHGEADVKRLVDELFRFLDLPVVDSVAQAAGDWKPAQPKEVVSKNIVGLDDEELKFLQEHPAYQRIMKDYGYAA